MGRPDFFLFSKTKVVDLAEKRTMAPLDYSLDDGKCVGLQLAEMTVFRRRTYAMPLTWRA